MPLYYFHIHVVNGTTTEDTEGMELSSNDEALAFGETLSSRLPGPAKNTVEVVDSRGIILAKFEIDAT
jgi:hypothetical protein